MKKVMQTGTYYTIVLNEDVTFTPWIVCSGYDKESGTWAQGHYFQNMMDAVEFFQAAENPAPEEDEETVTLKVSYSRAIRIHQALIREQFDFQEDVENAVDDIDRRRAEGSRDMWKEIAEDIEHQTDEQFPDRA